jgi:S-(hydroxymethyl)glutathione dehydrogenase / alcohol dehydrogenase
VTFPALLLMANGKKIQGSVYGTSDPARDIPVLARRGLLDLDASATRRIGIDVHWGALSAGRTGRYVKPRQIRETAVSPSI